MKEILEEISYLTLSKRVEVFAFESICFLPFLFKSQCYDLTHVGSASLIKNEPDLQ